jgi:RNAPII transcription regulator C-terminal
LGIFFTFYLFIIIRYFVYSFTYVISNNNTNFFFHFFFIYIISQILKALLQRDHPTWRGLVAVVINLVGFPGGVESEKQESAVAEIAANAFDLLLAEHTKDGEFLTKQSGAVVKVLYKQKFFTIVYPLFLFHFTAFLLRFF